MTDKQKANVERCKLAPIKDVTTPRNGMFNLYVGYSWVVTPNDEILLYRDKSPQCNLNGEFALKIKESLYPDDYTIKKIDVVYLEVSIGDYI